jgi:excisionase family DNA binding protein
MLAPIDERTTTEVRMETKKRWLTASEAAEHAAVSTDTIYTACVRSELRYTRIGGRRNIRFRKQWIDDWLERYSQVTPMGVSGSEGRQ